MKSLRAKFTALVLLLVAPFLLLCFQGIIIFSEHRQSERIQDLSIQGFSRLASELEGKNPLGKVAHSFQSSGLAELGAKAILLDRNGKTLWSSSPQTRTDREGTGSRQYALGEGVLVGIPPTAQLDKGVRRLSIVIAGIAMIAFSVLTWVLVGRVLRPVSMLSRSINVEQSIPKPQLVPPSTDSEMVELVTVMNELIAHISHEAQDKVDRYATLSHELRTPIQSLLLNLDVTLGHPRTKEELEETLLSVQSEVIRLHRLSEAVLTLHSIGTVNVHRDSERLVLAQSLQNIVDSLLPAFEIRDVAIVWDPSVRAELVGHPDQVELYFRNLLENAVRHCPQGTTVILSVESTDEKTLVQIQNEVDFESRRGGNGLGLRICREIAKVNQWGLTIIENEEGYSCSTTIPVPTNDPNLEPSGSRHSKTE